jgi:hypothetical protein
MLLTSNVSELVVHQAMETHSRVPWTPQVNHNISQFSSTSFIFFFLSHSSTMRNGYSNTNPRP